jgi:hypothetical protein
MKGFLILILALLLGTAAVLFYFWEQATQLPSWYRTDATGAIDLSQRSQLQQLRQDLETKIANRVAQTPIGEPVEVELDQDELGNLFASELTRKTGKTPLAKAVKGINTTVEHGRVESGAVLNLADVPVEQLPPREQSAVNQIIAAFPTLATQSLYVGVVGKPTVQNGRVKLNDNFLIKLGGLSFTPAELAKRLGVSETTVREQINVQLQLGKLQVSDVELVSDRAVIRGAAN